MTPLRFRLWVITQHVALAGAGTLLRDRDEARTQLIANDTNTTSLQSTEACTCQHTAALRDRQGGGQQLDGGESEKEVPVHAVLADRVLILDACSRHQPRTACQ